MTGVTSYIISFASIQTDIRDIKGPLSFPSRTGFYLSIIAAAVIVLLIVKAIYVIKNKIARKNAKPKTPHEIAYEALEALNRKDYIKEEKFKEYFTELSSIVRNYLESRFNLRAPEMTTQEFLLKVKDDPQLTNDHKRLLKDFLSCSDLVKFAKYGPSEKEIDSSFESAKKLIDETKEEENKTNKIKNEL